MDILFFCTLIPIMGLAVNVASQILTFRLLKQVGMLKSVFFGFFSGFAVFLALQFLLSPAIKDSSAGFFISNLLIYSALGYCYFHFINLGETARRIRMLNEIYHSEGGLSDEDILKRYNSNMIVDLRLKRLLSNNQLSFLNNRYFVKKSLMLYITKAIVFMKLILMGKKSEFD